MTRLTGPNNAPRKGGAESLNFASERSDWKVCGKFVETKRTYQEKGEVVPVVHGDGAWSQGGGGGGTMVSSMLLVSCHTHTHTGP